MVLPSTTLASPLGTLPRLQLDLCPGVMRFVPLPVPIGTGLDLHLGPPPFSQDMHTMYTLLLVIALVATTFLGWSRYSREVERNRSGLPFTLGHGPRCARPTHLICMLTFLVCLTTSIYRFHLSVTLLMLNIDLLVLRP